LAAWLPNAVSLTPTFNCVTLIPFKSIGQSADALAFAVDKLAHWCRTELLERYLDATQVLIEADSGGSSKLIVIWARKTYRQAYDQCAKNSSLRLCPIGSGREKMHAC